jgi:CheY-like chemotaxis protein
MEVTFARAGAPEAVAPASGAPADTRARTTPLRVLIVDDEPLILHSLGAMLADRATVVAETTAERAFERIVADAPYDAIVCDVMMPGMTGVDLHERVAREKPGMEARFVFITGGTYTARARDYLARIPNTRLAKPFDVARLLAEIERVASG